MDHFLIGEGIEGLLELFVRACAEPGDVAVMSAGTYPTVRRYIKGNGARVVDVPYLESGCVDLDGLLAAAQRHSAKLMYVVNPDNPTGTVLARHDVRELCARLPSTCVLLLDEAYAEFAPEKCVIPPQESWSNVVRLRTFSKAYGLAGARVGYAVADPAALRMVDRMRQRYGVSTLSQQLALGALADEEFFAQTLAGNAAGRKHYAAIADRIGVSVLTSAANFVAFDFGDPAFSSAVERHLEEHDVLVVRPTVAPLDRLIRVTVGTPEQRAYFQNALESFRSETRPHRRSNA